MTRPVDVWHVCGNPVTTDEGCGCTCTPNDPTRRRADLAVARLNPKKGGPVRTAPRHERGLTGKAGG